MGRSAIGAVAALLLALVAGAGALTTHRVSTAPAKPSAAGAAAGLPALRVPAATHARLALRGGGPPLPLFVGIGLSGAAAALLKLNENVRTAVMRFLDKQVLSKLRKSKRRNVRDGTWAQELQPSEEITSGYHSSPRASDSAGHQICASHRCGERKQAGGPRGSGHAGDRGLHAWSPHVWRKETLPFAQHECHPSRPLRPERDAAVQVPPRRVPRHVPLRWAPPGSPPRP